LWRSRGLVACGLALAALALVRPASAGPRDVDAGHDLSIVVPASARLTHHHFTSCADPVERFSVVDGRAVLTVEERLDGEPAPPRRGLFHVSGPPTTVECCAIKGRAGWVVHFRDHGRAFYAYLYPGGSSPAALLHVLNTLRVQVAPSA
jgi:hypothetical protein